MTTWRALPWRTDDAYTNMAIDKAIAESVAAGGPPTIRFYRWSGNGAVSYGASQAMSDFDTDFCRSQNIPFVRRFTEARAMYHDPSDFTYAIAVPVGMYRNRGEIGAVISSKIISFLEAVGIQNATQAGYTSILVDGKKISGSVSCYEQRKALFQHGSVFCRADYGRIAGSYRITEQELRKTTTSLEEQTGRGEGIEAIFQKHFLGGKDWQLGELTEQEKERVNYLRQQFAEEEWLSGGKKSRGVCSMHWGIPIPRFVTNMLAGNK